MSRRSLYVVISAAGQGTRMGASLPKQFMELDGKPILRLSIEKFISAVPGIRLVVVLPEGYIPVWKEYCRKNSFIYPQLLLPGGITRFHSVRNALARIPDGAIVAIHDGVRPLLSEKMIRNMFARISEDDTCHALIPVIPSVDTLKPIRKTKEEDGAETLSLIEGREIDRAEVYAAQTPQIFLSEDIKRAYEQPFSTSFTDDASVAAAQKTPLSFCEGERLNIKITTPEDLVLAGAVTRNLL